MRDTVGATELERLYEPTALVSASLFWTVRTTRTRWMASTACSTSGFTSVDGSSSSDAADVDGR